MTITATAIRDAAVLIEGSVRHTPQSVSRTLSEICGCTIVLKFENLQYTASFKERGALFKLLSLGDTVKASGVIAASAGNHAQGVAYHAQRLGIPSTIVMPEGTPFTKIRLTEDFGANVIIHGTDLTQATDYALRLAENGPIFIHPYDDPHVITGQGTVALEMLQDDPEIDEIVIPLGGGGLISGVAIAAKDIKPDITITGVEAALYPTMLQVLNGKPAHAGGQTVAEGIAVKEPGILTRETIRDKVDGILLADEAALEKAVLTLLEIEKTVVEGAGAAGLAAIMQHPEHFAGKRVGVILSGGNIDSRLLASILMRGLVHNGRLVRLRIDISDQPGLLGKVAVIIGNAGANIVEVNHQRLFHGVPLKMAELDVIVETRDDRHVDEVLEILRDAGYQATQLSALTGAEIALEGTT